MGMTLLEILQPTREYEFDPKLGTVHRAWDKGGRPIAPARAEAPSRPNKITKRCCDCKLRKRVNQFHTDPRTPDGYTAKCKACVSARRKELAEQRKEAP